MNTATQGAPESPRSKRSPPPLTIVAAGRTDRGFVRETNQDRFLVAAPGAASQAEPPSRPVQSQLFAVADGMGGHAGGEQASSIAVRTLGSSLLPALERVPAWATDEELEALVLGELHGAIERAHANIREEAERNPDLADMGTTLTVAYRHGARVFIAHVGDSRCYLLRDGTLFQLTRDHTVVNQLILAGFLDSADEASPALRSILTNAVGPAEPPVVETHQIRLRPGDALVLCTDGLTGLVSDAAIAAALEAYTDPDDAAEHLVDAALDAGGLDNVTVIVARCL